MSGERGERRAKQNGSAKECWRLLGCQPSRAAAVGQGRRAHILFPVRQPNSAAGIHSPGAISSAKNARGGKVQLLATATAAVVGGRPFVVIQVEACRLSASGCAVCAQFPFEWLV